MTRTCLGVAFILLLGCMGTPVGGLHAPLALTAVAGCYQFSWTRADSVLQDGFLYPDIVRLDLVTSCPHCEPDAPAAKNLSLGSPLPDTLQDASGTQIPWHRRFYASSWRIAPPDTVSIVFNGNYERWDVRLRPRGGALTGQAAYWSDGGTMPPATVTAKRTSCPIAA